LVENILAMAPDVVTLEEFPTLKLADLEFLTGEDGLAKIAAADETVLAKFRLAYWNKVAQSGANVAGKIFIDMDPLKGIRLPIIARLFPNAKIILMRRDPRDVVWSCFRTNFALTSAALEFLTLEQCARHYDALMRLTELALKKLPLSVHVLRYDQLIHEFEATLRVACDFAGVEWSPEMRHFDRTAKSRVITTASAAQVRKPLFDGTRQWERYRDQIAPVQPILRPWVEQFGFEV
jgi:hypothetical protein